MFMAFHVRSSHKAMLIMASLAIMLIGIGLALLKS
jgi:hypothetical protein